ncbi:MAG: cohesin domain-containing protein [Candidatus Gottesmanbacteria bacterium]
MQNTPRFRMSSLLTTLFLIGGLVLGVIAINITQDVRSRATNTAVSLSISPSQITGVLNQETTLNILMNTNGKTVSASEVYLIYDKTALAITNIVPGPYLPEVLSTATATNGVIAFIVGASPDVPKRGSGVIATITIKAIAKKISSIIFRTDTAVAVIELTTNAVGTKTGTTIVFSGTPTNTSTPSPQSTTTPIISTAPKPTQREKDDSFNTAYVPEDDTKIYGFTAQNIKTSREENGILYRIADMVIQFITTWIQYFTKNSLK